MKKDLKVLYSDAELDNSKEYIDFLRKKFATVLLANNGELALEKYFKYKPDFVITDIQMPVMNGVELIKTIRKEDLHTPIVLFSAHVNEPFITESFQKIINGVILKPTSNERLLSLINSIMSSKNKKDKSSPKFNKVPMKIENHLEDSCNDVLLVVGIGSSAGGLEALSALVAGLPEKNNTAYVVAQHLSPTHKTMLVDLLSRETILHVKDAVHGEILESDIIYITPPNNNIEIDSNNTIVLSEPDRLSFLPKPSVNKLFISLAMYKKDKAVGIILSGTGSDGAQGMRAINAEGGITFVQDPASAKFDGMSLASINGCNIDIITEPGLIGQELVALANFPRQKVLSRYQITQPNDNITTIFDQLHKYKKVDFSVYKKSTIGRRIERRMVALKMTNLTEYVEILKENKKEVELLYNDILIGVTSFFRDIEAYEALESILDSYLDQKHDNNELRIWMPGSSTGEEAYSIAMTVNELLVERQLTLNFRIFATDIDENALKIARNGLYSATSMANIPEDYIQKYFNIKDKEFQIKKSLREHVVFSFHNLLSDPPFKQIDLLVCRNLLIYFNLHAQKYIMPTFHYALKNNGILFLGKSENATNFEHFFVPINKVNKIFKSIPTSNENYNSLIVKPPVYTKMDSVINPTPQDETPLHEKVAIQASKLLLPNIIVTNEQLEVIYKKGSQSYLNIPEGYVSYNLYKIIDPRLSIDLRKLVSQSLQMNDGIVSSIYIPLQFSNQDAIYIQISLVPIFNERSKLYIFYFNQVSSKDFPQLQFNQQTDEQYSYDAMQLELSRTKEHMQTLIEELETSNEELQSTNEELQSSNEELQSTNEEMETSNEELQSTNEELQVAYAELKELYQNNSKIAKDLNLLNDRYTSVLDSINDIVVVSTLDGMFVRTNKRMESLTGLTKEQLLGKNWNDFFYLMPSNFSENREQSLSQINYFGPYSLELKGQGSKRNYLEVCDYLNKDEAGQIQIWTFAKDVTKEIHSQNQLLKSEQKFKSTFEYANVGIMHLNLQEEIIIANPTMLDMLGYSQASFQNITMADICHPDDKEIDTAKLREMVDTDEYSYKKQRRYYKKDGTLIWVSIAVSVVRENNLPDYFVFIIEDITKEKLLEAEYIQAQTVFNVTQEAILITDKEMNFQNVNPAFEKITGYRKFDIIGKHTRILKSEKHSKAFYEEMYRSLTITGIWSGEIINRTKLGEYYTAYLNITSVTDSNNKIVQYIGVITDISPLKQAQEKIKYLSNHDVLTNLPNRSLFSDRLTHALEQSKRTQKHVALLFVDLDRFKVVNDGLGHQIGDLTLMEVAHRFKEVLRNEDTVARLGGDEFVVILEGLSSPLKAGKVAQNIIDWLSKPMLIKGHTINIGASIGISVSPIDGITASELISQADIAMYDAKSTGGNSYRFTSEELSSSALQKATLEHSIRNGLNNSEFKLYFQPIVDFKTSEITYLEALIRWDNPNLGLISPSKFIPVAEESGLITEITKFVVYNTFITLCELQKATKSNVKIAINFSQKDLSDEKLFHYFKMYLDKFNLAGNSIAIELTERQLIAADDANYTNIERYRKLGVEFSMDDFGTGYSNLSYLMDKPFDTLKIDRSFISQLNNDPKSAELVKATILIAKALKLRTIGEGIETKEQWQFLKDNGCDFAQGFYLCTPKPIEKLKEIIIGNKLNLDDFS